MTEAPSIKEALEQLVDALEKDYVGDVCKEEAPDEPVATYCDGRCPSALTFGMIYRAKAALATLSPPAGERREAIARMIAEHVEVSGATLEAAGGVAAINGVNDAADAIIASGLVQNEAVWRDISTAPKDGTVIFVRRDNGCSTDYMVVWWNDSHNDGYPWRSDNNSYVEDRWDEWMLPTIRSYPRRGC